MRLTWPQAALWAAFAVLSVIAGLRLLSACDIGRPSLFNLGLKYCPVPVNYAALDDAAGTGRELESQIHDNELKIAEAPECAPPGQPAPISTPNPPPTEHEPEPEQRSLKIPSELSELKDLKGCWVSDRGDILLYDVYTKRHTGNARYCYCFGDDGRGTLKLKKSTGRTCKGPISAKLKDRVLRIDQPRFPCPPSSFIDHIVTCTPDESGNAKCSDRSREFPGESTDPEGYHRAEQNLCD